jgi:hypothetical protein
MKPEWAEVYTLVFFTDVEGKLICTFNCADRRAQREPIASKLCSKSVKPQTAYIYTESGSRTVRLPPFRVGLSAAMNLAPPLFTEIPPSQSRPVRSENRLIRLQPR